MISGPCIACFVPAKIVVRRKRYAMPVSPQVSLRDEAEHGAYDTPNDGRDVLGRSPVAREGVEGVEAQEHVQHVDDLLAWEEGSSVVPEPPQELGNAFPDVVRCPPSDRSDSQAVLRGQYSSRPDIRHVTADRTDRLSVA